jgi:hypothetical protein
VRKRHFFHVHALQRGYFLHERIDGFPVSGHFKKDEPRRVAETIRRFVQAEPCLDGAAVPGQYFLDVGHFPDPVKDVYADDDVPRFLHGAVSPAVPCPVSMTTSMRRFFMRPSSVSFEAMGLDYP